MSDVNWLDLFTSMDSFLLNEARENIFFVYITLFGIFFAETGLVIMAFLPGDSLLFVAGAVAAAGAMNVWITSLVVIAGAVAGNTVNYWIGAWLGRRIYSGKISWIDTRALARTQAFYKRHGGKTIIIARFIPLVRSVAPLVAGASGMHFRTFQFYNVIGAVLWVFILTGGGFVFGQVPFIKDNLSFILIFGIGIVLVPTIALSLWRAARRLAQ